MWLIFGVDLGSLYLVLESTKGRYVELPPFQDAMPEKQPDAPPSVVS
ncbi:hypothetical protein SLEP1_g40252 [Rubroshorea leprosula]|uniref:Uncharacterized protein n=1 Tax=Rubroshorea leprosula TaxID=152421 RepID=A0AAV5L347_9ROSI|nr:hypothetical protein SLEP1_g40252 [Rubroshorea leprosula]